VLLDEFQTPSGTFCPSRLPGPDNRGMRDSVCFGQNLGEVGYFSLGLAKPPTFGARSLSIENCGTVATVAPIDPALAHLSSTARLEMSRLSHLAVSPG